MMAEFFASSFWTGFLWPLIVMVAQSVLLLVDLAPGKRRLGGSALAQVFGQLGDESPDMDDPALVRRAFLGLAARAPHRYLVLDATEPVEHVAAAVAARVDELLAAAVAR